jgi:hypothetical protein
VGRAEQFNVVAGRDAYLDIEGSTVTGNSSQPYRYCPRFDSVSMARLADELLPVTSVRM